MTAFYSFMAKLYFTVSVHHTIYIKHTSANVKKYYCIYFRDIGDFVVTLDLLRTLSEVDGSHNKSTVIGHGR